MDKLLEQKDMWEKQLSSTLNMRDNPFFKNSQWIEGMKSEDFDDEITGILNQISRIVGEIETLKEFT